MTNVEVQGQLWGRAPRGWAEIQEPLHSPLWEAMLNGADVGAGTRFLDVGCGGGGASLLAAKRGARVSGIDAAEGLLAFARERVPDGDFHKGDIERLPFDAASYDTVFAANSLQYAEDPIAALRELARVCVPGGRIAAGLFGPSERVAFSAVQAAVRSTLPDPPEGAGPYDLSAPGKLEGVMREAGLNVLDYGEVDCPFSYADFDTYWQANLSAGPFQRALEVVPVDKLREAVHSATEPFRLENGLIQIQPNIFIFVVAGAGTA